MTGKPFVPPDFVAPAVLETPHFHLRMLSTADVDKDYEAVMESVSLLNAMFGPEWPTSDFTLADNLADLERHQREFEQRAAFAYTVVSLDETTCLGCVYINPPRGQPTGARVHMWVRQSAYDQGLDLVLFQAVRAWLAEQWPFAHVTFPGRHDRWRLASFPELRRPVGVYGTLAYIVRLRQREVGLLEHDDTDARPVAEGSIFAEY